MMSGDSTFPVGVSVLMVNKDGKLLLGERNNCKGAGLLSTPGGRIEQHETMFDAAYREVLEETGVAITGNISVIGFKEHRRFEMHYFMVYLLVREWSGKIRNCEPDRCGGWGWYEPDAIPQDRCTEPADILEKLY
jgi:8-oxo-dGTP diphosphatase